MHPLEHVAPRWQQDFGDRRLRSKGTRWMLKAGMLARLFKRSHGGRGRMGDLRCLVWEAQMSVGHPPCEGGAYERPSSELPQVLWIGNVQLDGIDGIGRDFSLNSTWLI